MLPFPKNMKIGRFSLQFSPLPIRIQFPLQTNDWIKQVYYLYNFSIFHHNFCFIFQVCKIQIGFIWDVETGETVFSRKIVIDFSGVSAEPFFIQCHSVETVVLQVTYSPSLLHQESKTKLKSVHTLDDLHHLVEFQSSMMNQDERWSSTTDV